MPHRGCWVDGIKRPGGSAAGPDGYGGRPNRRVQVGYTGQEGTQEQLTIPPNTARNKTCRPMLPLAFGFWLVFAGTQGLLAFVDGEVLHR